MTLLCEATVNGVTTSWWTSVIMESNWMSYKVEKYQLTKGLARSQLTDELASKSVENTKEDSELAQWSKQIQVGSSVNLLGRKLTDELATKSVENTQKDIVHLSSETSESR